MDFFQVKTMLLKKLLSCFFVPIFILSDNPPSDFQIFNFSECKDDFTGLFTLQPIAAGQDPHLQEPHHFVL